MSTQSSIIQTHEYRQTHTHTHLYLVICAHKQVLKYLVVRVAVLVPV